MCALSGLTTPLTRSVLLSGPHSNLNVACNPEPQIQTGGDRRGRAWGLSPQPAC